MATNNCRIYQSPVYAGLFCALMILAGCANDHPPETVTRLFWQALVRNDLPAAKQFVSRDSQALVTQAPQPAWKIDTLKTGEIRINGEQATVATEVGLDRPVPAPALHFATHLVRENGLWKIDYRRTEAAMPQNPFGELLQNLQNLGETFGKQLEKQLPIFEKGIEKFGERLNEQLNEQLEQFERDLDKAFPPPKKPQAPGRQRTL